MRDAIAGSATLSRSTSSSPSPLFPPSHATLITRIYTHTYITRSQRLTRGSTSKPLSGITQTSPPPPSPSPSHPPPLLCLFVHTHVCARARPCASMHDVFCVYAEPTIHSRIRLASTGFVAKAYIHGSE